MLFEAFLIWNSILLSFQCEIIGAIKIHIPNLAMEFKVEACNLGGGGGGGGCVTRTQKHLTGHKVNVYKFLN